MALILLLHIQRRGLCGRDRMIVGFITTCAIGAYQSCEFQSC